MNNENLSTFSSDILVVDDVSENLKLLLSLLTPVGYKVRPASNGAEALDAVMEKKPDLILLDIKMPGMDGFEVCKRLKADSQLKKIPIIFISALGETADKVKAFHAGGVDYITKPFQEEEVLMRVQTHIELHRMRVNLESIVAERTLNLQMSYEEIKQLKKRLEHENIFLRQEIEIQFRHDEIVGDSDAMKGVLSQAEMVAKQDTSILILGETGTGKELIARAIHNISPRKNRAMIKVNCAALPATLIESELFGREKGAFTGALARQVGRFEAADGSTIFLDEIGDLPLEMQAKLLRVLHDGQFERLGSAESVFADVRVIAATNHNLEQEMREGRFRQDLYYRLSVFPITVPPLRERREDIPLLAWSFVREFGESMGKSISEISKKDMDTLKSYSWPGNVRELKNIIERAMILSTGATLHLDPMSSGDVEAMHSMTLEGVEKSHILEVVESTGWKISGRNGAAEVLGLKESTLRARMKKLGIQRKK